MWSAMKLSLSKSRYEDVARGLEKNARNDGYQSTVRTEVRRPQTIERYLKIGETVLDGRQRERGGPQARTFQGLGVTTSVAVVNEERVL
jgi:hypothetical protein